MYTRQATLYPQHYYIKSLPELLQISIWRQCPPFPLPTAPLILYYDSVVHGDASVKCEWKVLMETVIKGAM